MSMGGGGGGGSAVVSGPSPAAAIGAGYLQAQAAAAAGNVARQQTNDAINLIRQNYSSAFQALKPYTSEGITALNELNRYMGLGAYNPGTAPTAPKANTIENALGKITDAQVRDYVFNNSTFGTNPKGSFFGYYNYGGAGADDAGVAGAMQNKGDAAGIRMNNVTRNLSTIANSDPYKNAIKQALAKEYVQQNQEGYESQMDLYNQQMDLYNLAQDQYQNYGGNYTPEQVQEKLMSQPGVAFQYNQGLDAIQRAASARGMLGSGRLLQSLADYGQGMASQQYGETLSRLAGLAGMGQQSATNAANIFGNLGQSTGQLTANLGDTLANSYLARGNALSQSLLASNQRHQIIGGGGGGGLGGIGSVLGGLGSLIGSSSTGGSGLMGLFR
jgi:hypothetical protein